MTEPTRKQPGAREVHAGFIALADCAPLVIARERGFDRQQGFTFRLHREASWANIRDKLDIGAFDCAHMLAPMPIAATLGLGRTTKPVVAPMSLSLNGNAITASRALYAEMRSVDASAAKAGGMAAANALAEVVRQRGAEGREPLTLGMVYPFSCHNYDLRYWLAAAGIDPDNDVNLVVVPPPLLAESLKAGRVDGFCVGQPWNSVSVGERNGVIIATKSELWPLSPEKVLGVREDWAQSNGELLGDIVRALSLACQWLDAPDNRREAAEILARPQYVGVAESIMQEPLTGNIVCGEGRHDVHDADSVVFFRHDANFPWRSHAVWLITQMIRWGQAREPFDIRALANRVYRSDIYREAVAELGIEVPSRDYKPEGRNAAASAESEPALSSFFSSNAFDPDAAVDYLRALAIRAPSADIEAFAAENL